VSHYLQGERICTNQEGRKIVDGMELGRRKKR
jgi:hypothetical protein